MISTQIQLIPIHSLIENLAQLDRVAIPVIPAHRRLRQEDSELETSLGQQRVQGQPGLCSKTMAIHPMSKKEGMEPCL